MLNEKISNMKFKLLALSMLLFGISASAQNPYIAPQGAVNNGSGIVVSEPRTTLAVDVTAQCERIIAGPYARYAQKFLGVRPAITDKVMWNIRSASVSLLDAASLMAGELPAAKTEVMSHASAADDFARLQCDKLSASVLSLEDAARDAANALFSLRRHRVELITGEAGENVFGAGLKAALEEIERLEQEYLELFLGKRILSTVTRRYVVNPQADKKQYVVCRFTPTDGLLPESDLSGNMIVLQIEPSGNTASVVDASNSKERNLLPCRVADPSTCVVSGNGQEYGRSVLPLFEFGRTIPVVNHGASK